MHQPENEHVIQVWCVHRHAPTLSVSVSVSISLYLYLSVYLSLSFSRSKKEKKGVAPFSKFLKLVSFEAGQEGSRASATEFFIDNLLIRIHLIIVMIRWTGLAPWEFESPFPGELTSTFLEFRGRAERFSASIKIQRDGTKQKNGGNLFVSETPTGVPRS